MNFKSKDDVKEHIETLGMCAISKLSSIRVLSKMGLPLGGMLGLEQLIAEIECTLWSILPLGLDAKDSEKFNDQCKYLEEKVAIFRKAALAMNDVMKTFKE